MAKRALPYNMSVKRKLFFQFSQKSHCRLPVRKLSYLLKLLCRG